jgi:spermidine synthase
MLRAAKEHMGVRESKYLKLVQADGLDFIRPDFNCSIPPQHAYDVIILDVAVPAKVPLLRSLGFTDPICKISFKPVLAQLPISLYTL